MYGKALTLGIVSVVLLGSFWAGWQRLAPAVSAADDQMCFNETGKCIKGAFLAYWQSHGGLTQQGLPVSDEFSEQQAPPPTGDGRVHVVQYFERARFEHHSEFAGSENEVLLGLLGGEQYQAKYVNRPQPPQTFRGSGTQALAPLVLREGLATFRMTHDGRRNFIVQVMTDRGVYVDYPANAIGAWSGSKAVPIKAAGAYVINVTADGNWTITIEQ